MGWRCGPGLQRPRRSARRGRAVRHGAAILLAGLAAFLCACSPKAKAGPVEYPFPAANEAAFVVGPGGFVALPAVGGDDAGKRIAAAVEAASVAARGGSEPLPLPLAPRVAALAAGAAGSAATASSGTVLAALNGFGLGILRLSPDGKAWKLLNLALAEAKTGSVAALWPRGEAFLLELYRDPFVQGGPAPSDAAPELLTIDATGLAARLERLGGPGEDLFALFPSPSGKWYAELRTEKALGATTRYFELAWPESLVGGKELSRGVFETSLAPKPLSLAPACLRAAAAAAGGAGPLLVHARSGDGTEAYWISGGSAEEATELEAWVAKGEDAAVALSRAGRGALMRTGAPEARAFSLAAPAAGARFSAVAALAGTGATGGSGLVVAAWDSGDFPCVAASGIVVAPLP